MIKVEYKVFSTIYNIRKALKKLEQLDILSYDCETQTLYDVDEVKEAKKVFKTKEQLEQEDRIIAYQIANASGLSNPRIVKVTHFIFGISKDQSIILIARSPKTELMIMDWLVEYNGKLVIHNSLFDLKLVYHRTGKFPKNVEDTQLLAKSLINDADDFKARTGLKILMGRYYDPKWTMIETYDVKDYKDPNFLRYCAIDGASTFYLWEQLQEAVNETEPY